MIKQTSVWREIYHTNIRYIPKYAFQITLILDLNACLTLKLNDFVLGKYFSIAIPQWFQYRRTSTVHYFCIP